MTTDLHPEENVRCDSPQVTVLRSQLGGSWCQCMFHIMIATGGFAAEGNTTPSALNYKTGRIEEKLLPPRTCTYANHSE